MNALSKYFLVVFLSSSPDSGISAQFVANENVLLTYSIVQVKKPLMFPYCLVKSE